jgi:uncharacterized protein YuzE
MRRSNISGNRREYVLKDLSFSYDRLNDLLYIYKKDSNVYSNVIIGEFHLEFDKAGELVGVEILKASEILKEYSISKKLLENIKKTELKVVITNNSLLVFLVIQSLDQEKSATITMNNLESHALETAIV